MASPYDNFLANSPTPYDAAIAALGLSAPNPSNKFTRDPRGGMPLPAPFNPYNPTTRAYLEQLNGPRVAITVPSGGQGVPFQQNPTDPITDIQANLQRDIDMPVVQQGSHVFSADEIQQRQEVAQSASNTLGTLQPLIQQGLLGNNFVSHAIGQSVSNSLETQRDRTAAGRDLRAVNKAYREGAITDANYNEALNQVQKKYGIATLSSVPEYAASQNSLHDLANSRATQIQQWEQQNNANGLGGWDEDNNRPSIDHHKLSDQYSLSLLRGQEAKARKDQAQPLIDINKNKVAIAQAEYNFKIKQSEENIRTMRSVFKDKPTALNQAINQEIVTRKGWFDKLKSEIGASAPQQTITEHRISVATPEQLGTPVYKNAGIYTDSGEASNAIKSGEVKPGQYFTVGGKTLRLNQNGSVSTVQ